MIKTVEIHSNEIARDVSETLRKLKAAQYTAAHPGEVCPAKWKEGEKTLAPSLDRSARSKAIALLPCGCWSKPFDPTPGREPSGRFIPEFRTGTAAHVGHQSQDPVESLPEKVTQPFEIVASLDDGEKSQELLSLLQDIAGLSDKITLKTDGDDARKPSFSLNRIGGNISLRFAGIPMGHEFTSLVLALLQVGGHPSKTAPEVIEQIKALDGDYRFETYFRCPARTARTWSRR